MIQVSFINWTRKMSSSQVLLLLMMICGVSCLSLPPQRSKVTRFRVNITESGTKFDEELEIDTKEDTEVFHVPQHNNVDQSDIMHMFALNLTIFRFPLKGLCYVAPLERDQPPPKKLVDDMSQTINDSGTTIQSSSYRITEKAQDLQFWTARIQSFCRGLDVYHVEPVDVNSVTMESQDKQAKRRRRQSNSARPISCPESQVKNCSPDNLYRDCWIEGRACVYFRKCYFLYDSEENMYFLDCKVNHVTDEIICCTTKCQS